MGKGLFESLRDYPPAVFFMLGNEFCERFSFYGMRAILTIYVIIEHHFSERFVEKQLNFFYLCVFYSSRIDYPRIIQM